MHASAESIDYIVQKSVANSSKWRLHFPRHALCLCCIFLTIPSPVCCYLCSYVGPGSSERVRALQELSQGQPLEGEDLAGLKGRLAAGAAEALDQQIR
jgi:hypothetical protein